MKKLLAIILTLIMILSLASCGKKTDDAAVIKGVGKSDIKVANAEGVLADVLKKGVLTVGTSPDYPPAEYVDLATNELKGSEMVLAQYIANTLGVKLVVEQMDFAGVLTAVDTGKVDLGISGFGYKADRAESYELSHGYSGTGEASHHTILVPASEKDNYKSLADFAGKHLNAQAGSLQQMYVEDQIENPNLELVSTLDQAILNLQTGKVDAIALDKTTAQKYAASSEGMFYSVFDSGIEFDLSLYDDYAGNVMACKKGETSFVSTLNQIIDDVTAKGLYSEWYAAAKKDAGIEDEE